MHCADLVRIERVSRVGLNDLPERRPCVCAVADDVPHDLEIESVTETAVFGRQVGAHDTVGNGEQGSDDGATSAHAIGEAKARHGEEMIEHDRPDHTAQRST